MRSVRTSEVFMNETDNELFKRRKVINRRAFLYGAGTIAIGLPFLEGLAGALCLGQRMRSRSSASSCAALCGVEPKRFWPESTGDLSTPARFRQGRRRAGRSGEELC
jgi:hypothetical protein